MQYDQDSRVSNKQKFKRFTLAYIMNVLVSMYLFIQQTHNYVYVYKLN